LSGSFALDFQLLPCKLFEMATTSATFYLSYHDHERTLAKELVKQIQTADSAKDFRFTDRDSTPLGEQVVAYQKQWVEAADVVLLFRSPDFFHDQTLHFEKLAALSSPREPLILVINAKDTVGMPGLEDYREHLVPSPGTFLRNSDALIEARHIQLAASDICHRVMRFLAAGKDEHSTRTCHFTFEQMRERLFSFISKNNLSAALHLLLRLIHDTNLERAVFEAIEEHTRLHQQARTERFNFHQFWEQTEAIRFDLEDVVLKMEESMLHPSWPQVFESEYLGFSKIEAEGIGMMGLFTQADDIVVPEMGSAGDSRNNAEYLLTESQKLEFKRLFILAQDEEAVGRPQRAFAYCEQIKNTLEPESAQLYEHLLLNFAKKETPKAIIERALRKEDRALNFVVLYAGRFKHYAQHKICFSPTGYYNVAEVADGLSNALRAVYAQIPNDYILDTGKNAERHPPALEHLQECRRIAVRLYNYVHTSEGFLEVMLNEICGGGKCQWLERIGVEEGRFRVYNLEDFDLLGEISSIQRQIAQPPPADPDNPVETAQRSRASRRRYNQLDILRENLLISLREKRNALQKAVQKERQYYREFLDEHQSVARYVYACITGYLAFDQDRSEHAKSEFLELALRELVTQPSAVWFTLDENGELRTHEKHRSLHFDAFELTEAIIRHFAGQRGLQDVRAQLKEAAYRQFLIELSEDHQEVVTGLQWTDFRRMDDFEARHKLIACFRKWMIAYRAYPERGQVFLENSIREIVGDGLLLWLHHNPSTLVSHADSLALGYDAQAALKQLISLSDQFTEIAARERTAHHLFHRRIMPAYRAIKPGDESKRPEVVRYLLEALANYQLHPDLSYLDFVFHELTDEIKYRWVNITEKGEAKAWVFKSALAFNPLSVLNELIRIAPARYACMDVRERLAERRHADQLERYYLEISEFRYENRRPERAIAVDILWKMRGIYLFFPKEKYLELPITELTGKGRIRWNALFLGFFPTRENHFENQFYRFNYRFELFEFKRLLDQQYYELQRVMSACEASTGKPFFTG